MTARDDDILHTLARCARLITAVQAARLWWPEHPLATKWALRRLRQIVDAGWLVECRVLAQPLLELSSAIAIWHPGESPPSAPLIARQLRTRWRQPARQVNVFVAATSTLRAFGLTRGRPIKAHHQVTHDLHVAQVYVRWRELNPELALQWVGEDSLAPTGPFHVVPDAMLVAADGRPLRAIEFGGRYPAHRLIRFHQDCEARNLPYEIW